MRAWARTAPRSDFSSSGVNSDETPISPIRPMRAPSMPCERLGHDLVGDGVDRHSRQRRRVRALQVVAGAHDDIEPGGPRDSLQGRRVAADAAAGGIDHANAACMLEGEQFGDRQRLVVERAIVEIDEWVHPQLADDALVHGLGREMLALGLGSAGATSSGSH